MTVTLINVGGTTVVASIRKADGGGMDQNGAISGGEFGVSISSGAAYFDTNGATVGEGATLGYNGSTGQFFLKSGTVNDQPHLMLLRQEARERHVSTPVDLASRMLRQEARADWMLDAPIPYGPSRQWTRDTQESIVGSDAGSSRERARRDMPGLTVDDGWATRARNEAWRRAPSASDLDRAQVDSNAAAYARNAAWRRPPAAWSA